MKSHLRKAANPLQAGTPANCAPGSTTRVTAGTTPNSSRPVPIDPQWSWHHRTLIHLRDRLLRAQAEHSREASSLAEMTGGDVADTAQEKSDRDLLWAELGAEKDRLFEVDCALQRLRDASYGLCEETGQRILPERLRAIPWTRYSHDAAQRHEQRFSVGTGRMHT